MITFTFQKEFYSHGVEKEVARLNSEKHGGQNMGKRSCGQWEVAVRTVEDIERVRKKTQQTWWFFRQCWIQVAVRAVSVLLFLRAEVFADGHPGSPQVVNFSGQFYFHHLSLPQRHTGSLPLAPVLIYFLLNSFFLSTNLVPFKSPCLKFMLLLWNEMQFTLNFQEVMEKESSHIFFPRGNHIKVKK